jgi:hypothetical protein
VKLCTRPWAVLASAERGGWAFPSEVTKDKAKAIAASGANLPAQVNPL